MILVAIGLIVFFIAFISKKGRLDNIVHHHSKFMAEHTLNVRMHWFKECIAIASLDEMEKYELERDRILKYARKYTTKEDWARRKMDRMIYIRMVELTNVAFS